jgi:hypothetical protein
MVNRGGLPLATIIGADSVGTRWTHGGPGWTRLGGRSGRWVFGPILVGAAAAGAASTLDPLYALVAVLLLGVVACVWKWPALGAFLIIGLTPLTAGVNRGSAFPLLRPNEAIVLIVGVVLVARGFVRLRSGQLPRLRIGAVEASIVLLAVCSSVLPLLWMAVRQEQITSDDLLYTLVLWKFLGLYAVIRMSVTTDRQILSCLWISVAAACIVAAVAIVQSLGLFGVPKFLSTFFAPFGYTDAFQARGSSTLGLPAATADLMVYNLAIVGGMWSRGHRHRLLLTASAGLLVLGALSAGEFSGVIGLLVGIACIAAVTNSARLLKVLVPAGLMGSVLVWPVLAVRLGGFQSVSGLPVSWTERVQNLQNYFWPQLFADWNWVLGVRPAARVAVATQGTGYVWIESGYTWLLWGGGIPLLAAFVFFVVATAKRGWRVARGSASAAGIAGTALFVAVVVTAVLMVFDPHLTYRGSGDAMFIFAALATTGTRRPKNANSPNRQQAPVDRGLR